MTIQTLLSLDLTNQKNVDTCLSAIQTGKVSLSERGDNDLTLLHAAAGAGCVELIKEIIGYAPSLLSAVDRSGKTAAQYAFDQGHQIIGTALLEVEKHSERKQAFERAYLEIRAAELEEAIQGEIFEPAKITGETKRQHETSTLIALLVEDHLKKPEEIDADAYDIVEFSDKDSREAHELVSRDISVARIQGNTNVAFTERFNQVTGFFSSVGNVFFDLANGAFHVSKPARKAVENQLLTAYDQSKSVLTEAAVSTLTAANSITRSYLSTAEAPPADIEMDNMMTAPSTTSSI